MPKQAGAADVETEEIVEQIFGFAQRDAEVRAAIGGQQTCTWADVGAGQFEIAAALAGLLASAATMDVSAIAMPFEFGFGNVGDDVILEVVGGFEIVAAAMAALLGMNVVFDEAGVRRRFGPKRAWMLAMFLAAAVVGRTLAWRRVFLLAFASLQELLHLMLQLRDPLAQLGVFRFEFRNPLVAWIIHDRCILPKTAERAKTSCLTVTFFEPLA